MNRVAADLKTRWPTLAYKPSRLVVPRPDPTAIVLGRDQNRRPVLLPLRARLQHWFILGATGAGKSRLLLHLTRQAIANGEGLCFLDPHGTEFQNLLVSLKGTSRRVHIMDFSAPQLVGFNPLACPDDTDPSVIVGNVMDALAVSWEGESLAQKPTIERVMSAILAALVELKLTICEAPYILDHADSYGLRRYAIENVRDGFTRSVLARLHELSLDGRRKRDFDQEVVGPENRLARLLRPPTIRAMLGQTANCIDFKSVMDNGEIVLANLSGGTEVYEKDADLFGRLLTRTALFHAKRRRNTQPFNLVLDEAHRFLSADIPVLLAEVRKFGVSIIAAMQWLAQAKAYDENILEALLNGTNCKICFRLRDAEEAEKMAHSIIPLDLERPVAALIKPTVIGHQRTLLANESTSEQHSETESRALAIGETHGTAFTEGETQGTSRSDHTSSSQSESATEMRSSSEGNATGEGASASEIMIPTADEDDPIISRETAGTSSSSGKSSSNSRGSASSVGSVQSKGSTTSTNYSSSRAYTESRSNSRVATQGDAVTKGTGLSKGHSEALEPIMANLPTAVHSMQNELYAAGTLLRSLPTAVAFLNYVGQSGAVATLFTVPPIFAPKVSDDEFKSIRRGFLQGCASVQVAHLLIAEREERLIEQCGQLSPEPKQPPKPKPSTPKGEVLW